MSAAALLTFGLAGVTWFMSCQTHGATAGQVDGSLARPEARSAAIPARPVTVRTADIRVHEITPDLITRQVDPTPSAPARRGQPTATPDSLPRRLARAITGDGRHQVRPFPTPE